MCTEGPTASWMARNRCLVPKLLRGAAWAHTPPSSNLAEFWWSWPAGVGMVGRQGLGPGTQPSFGLGSRSYHLLPPISQCVRVGPPKTMLFLGLFSRALNLGTYLGPDLLISAVFWGCICWAVAWSPSGSGWAAWGPAQVGLAFAAWLGWAF